MALTDEQRGPRAAYLNRHLKRYGTGDAALKKLAADMERLGFSRSWSTYKGWVSSDDRSPIPPEAEPYFLKLFNEPVPPPRAPAATQAELIAALAAQTKAINDLVAVLQDDSLEVRLRVVEALVLPREQPDGGGSREQFSPRVTTG